MEKKQVLEQCYFCGNLTLMNVVGTHRYLYTDEDCDEFTGKSWVVFYEDTTWYMNSCPVCNNITLTKEYSNSEMIKGWGPGSCEKTVIYPIATFSAKDIPNIIKTAYESALKVRNIDNSICLIALRRTLESICKDKGAMGKTLYSMIKDLSDKSILPPILNGISDVLRELGNEAAHGSDIQHYKEDVDLMFEFTESIINYVYILPIKLSNIQAKLSQHKNKTTK